MEGLWLPVLASAVIVWIASALVWMVMPWHKSDFRKTSNEEGVRAALSGLSPGLYLVPYCVDPAQYKEEAMRQKYAEGPVAYVTMAPNGLPSMGPKLVMSFVLNLVVGSACAYVLASSLTAEADYMDVFRVAGTTAFVAYGIAYLQESIWFARPWALTAKSLLDAAIYGLLTAGTFGWLAT